VLHHVRQDGVGVHPERVDERAPNPTGLDRVQDRHVVGIGHTFEPVVLRDDHVFGGHDRPAGHRPQTAGDRGEVLGEAPPGEFLHHGHQR
jgi:hypothetical protein